ncbi:STAS domain-containing protein [Actinospica sp. MGRD01-02]|uniref:STAS domain-containing protein n=1 Tax=Actinospica acidithermotolerans TaxID=2828514 RepID=A0A941EHJ2_9ACTN|nr:STAS domain-containing protein [Actinospica acidithermotolerans]MBR7830523.1 STAS domain-containing protein [Actinospica acidithermotolerans]
MAFDARLGFAGTTANLHLAGEMAEGDAARLRSLVDQATARPLRRLVLYLGGLESLTVSGVRCLAMAQQQLAPGTEVIVDGVGENVVRLLRLGGLDRSVTLVPVAA